jgi:peptidoglycan/xylan/chitin deacetylase (PgdA/CDA1 family)
VTRFAWRNGIRRIKRRCGASTRIWRARLSGDRLGIVLVYHDVVESVGAGERLVPVVTTKTLAAHADCLRRMFRPVSASELPDAARSRRRGGRIPVAVTFDDDLRTHMSIAGPVLAARGMTATFFLGGAALDGPHLMWWENLQRGADSGIAPRELLAGAGLSDVGPGTTLAEAGSVVQALAPSYRRTVEQSLERALPPPTPDAGLRSEDVSWLAANGFEIGFHTRLHDALPDLDDEELDAALRDGVTELEQAAGRGLRVIAYPHGRADDRAAAAAARAGFVAGFTTADSVWTAGTDPHLIGRLTPAARTADQLAAELASALTRSR